MNTKPANAPRRGGRRNGDDKRSLQVQPVRSHNAPQSQDGESRVVRAFAMQVREGSRRSPHCGDDPRSGHDGSFGRGRGRVCLSSSMNWTRPLCLTLGEPAKSLAAQAPQGFGAAPRGAAPVRRCAAPAEPVGGIGAAHKPHPTRFLPFAVNRFGNEPERTNRWHIG